MEQQSPGGHGGAHARAGGCPEEAVRSPHWSRILAGLGYVETGAYTEPVLLAELVTSWVP